MRIGKIILFSLLLLFVINPKIINEDKCIVSNETNHSYDEISHLIINYQDIFLQTEQHYFVYFYTFNCGHCYQLKNYMISYALCNQIKTYFISENNDIKYGSNTNKTIGINDIEQLFILGYPSLIEIKNKALIYNEAGKDKILKKIMN